LGLAHGEDVAEEADADPSAALNVVSSTSAPPATTSTTTTTATTTAAATMFTTIDVDLLAHDSPPSFDFSSSQSHADPFGHGKKRNEKEKNKDKTRATKASKTSDMSKDKKEGKARHPRGSADPKKARRRSYDLGEVFRVNPQSHSALSQSHRPHDTAARAQAALVSVFSVNASSSQHRTSAAGHRAQHAGTSRRPQPVITKPRHPHKAHKKAKARRRSVVVNTNKAHVNVPETHRPVSPIGAAEDEWS